ncbi:MAG: sugar ABC transporter ATP-binding protein [Ardenticatenaceae bacterium]|nr:sugar ABC transporter ATP-binding protein [Ardenticatenaceae bacterium]
MTVATTNSPAEAETVTALPPDEIIMRAVGMTKLFPGTVALDHVDFNVYRGKVNVLVGENGAGKSTLMKILAGVYQPTEGQLLLEGQPVTIKNPLDAARQGIGIIYQEMNLFPNLNVMENIFMAREMTNGRLVIDKKAQIAQTEALLQRLRQSIKPDDLVADLRIGQQQIVEIAKALAQDARILIMDEPTSALSTAEVEVLFEVINDLKANGVSVIYISHKLDELLQIGDYVTVLRDGRLVDEKPAGQIDVSWIIEQMVGRNPASLFQGRDHEVGDALLRVEDLTLPRVGGGYTVDHVSFTLRQGEILGIYGLMGAGRSELFECLAGVRQGATGRVWLDGEEVTAGTVDGRIKLGMYLVPEDRQRDGLVQTMSVADNMLLPSLRQYLNRFVLSRKKEKEAVTKSIKNLSVKVANPNQLITSLSGGNQQKVVVAKSLLTSPKVLLLDEPSRGIDVAAKSEIFEIMSRLAGEGYGILFISSELKEILAMSDRILVMSKGQITGEFAKATATEEDLVAASAVGHGLANYKNGNGGNSHDPS